MLIAEVATATVVVVEVAMAMVAESRAVSLGYEIHLAETMAPLASVAVWIEGWQASAMEATAVVAMVVMAVVAELTVTTKAESALSAALQTESKHVWLLDVASCSLQTFLGAAAKQSANSERPERATERPHGALGCGLVREVS